jgi:hypothetical protein
MSSTLGGDVSVYRLTPFFFLLTDAPSIDGAISEVVRLSSQASHREFDRREDPKQNKPREVLNDVIELPISPHRRATLLSQAIL